MIVAILADTHMPRGARAIPGQCMDRMRSADVILHAGDFTQEPVLDALEALGPPVLGVHGNMDSAVLRGRLPEQLTFEAAGVRIAMIHDAGPARDRLARLRRRFPGADAVVFGHSHLPLHERDGDFQIFNPGSPTERRRAPRHTMGIARIRSGALEFELLELG
jgi:putative phosphoesterase